MGSVYYRESINKTILAKAADEITAAFPSIPNPDLTWTFVTTYDNVGFYGARNTTNCTGVNFRNTFQIILTTDGYHSFVILNYNKITWTAGTASGGNQCTGLGGRPAKAGFDYGDNTMLYTIEGSCYESIVNISQSSNVDYPGKWIFKVDQKVDSASCVDYSDKIKIAPVAVSMLGYSEIVLSGPCFNNYTRAVCIFHDKELIEVVGVFSPDKRKVFCLTAPFQTWGMVSVSLTLTLDNFTDVTFHGSIYTTATPRDTLSLDTNADTTIFMSWDPLSFRRVAVPAAVEVRAPAMLEISLINVYMTPRNKIIYATPIQVGDPIVNIGQYEVNLPLNITALTNLSSTFFIALSLKNPNPVLFPVGKYVLSELLHSGYGKTLADLQVWCDNWFKDDLGPPRIILPCPPSLPLAQMDGRYQSILSSGAEEIPNSDDLIVNKFIQTISNFDGSGQECFYNQKGQLVSGPPFGGSANLVSPHSSLGPVGHHVADVAPYLMCCIFGNSMQNCSSYYVKRPSNYGLGYVPPRFGFGFGDPHISTVDGVRYTFNGVGEFWMVYGSSQFGMQCRMEQFIGQGGSTNASVFTAFAFKEANRTIQVEWNRLKETFNVYLDHVFVSSEVLIGEGGLVVDGVSIHIGNGTILELSFSSGFFFEIKSAPGAVNALSVTTGVYGNQVLNKGYSGLLGRIDGRTENDLTSRNGNFISVNSSLAEIHRFGISWATFENESLFYYQDGKSHGSYQNLNFTPNFETPQISNLPGNVVAMCNGSVECLYDFASTGSKDFAEGTKVEVKIEKVLDAVVRSELNDDNPTCVPLPNPKNGYVISSNIQFNGVARFYCNAGFKLVGNSVVACSVKYGNDAVWNGTAPICVRGSGPPKKCVMDKNNQNTDGKVCWY